MNTCSVLRLCLLGMFLAVTAPTHRVRSETPLSTYAGTWTGTSTCVAKNRPACKNEIVVYRFVTMTDHPKQLRQLADKIIDGKRVPMGSLDFALNEHTGRLESEFKVASTHGVWWYSVAGDSMTGALIILPDSTIGRDVKVHRVKDTEVPPAPALKEYEE